MLKILMLESTISGFRATNKLHIGNIFGTLTQMKQLTGEIFIMIVDLHAMTEFTVDYNDIIFNVKVFLALIENKNVNIYLQSHINGLTDLMWILCSHCNSGDLFRMTQFKSKENPHCGFLLYPILMAADILIINADKVAVGPDQTQHVELTNKIARNFNNYYKKDIFTITNKEYIGEIIIKDLVDVSKKMSKSNSNEKGTIFLTDKPEVIEKKIMKAKTDSLNMPNNIGEIKYSRPEIYNLCLIYSLCTENGFEYIESKFQNQPIVIFKKELIKKINLFLENIQNKVSQFNNQEVENILKRGSLKVNEIASKNMNQIYNIIYKNQVISQG